ncbi:MAG: hypothetical protein KJZ85_15660 [Rhodobacteraceae bacterium]|jgi:hypothetical protein|nr:hypothetical protein [Paracoccaceae bacterium]
MSRALRRILRIRRFRRDERGAMSVEALLILPMLLWAYMAMFIYWDAFRAINTHTKATYTVADMLSREMNPVSSAYIDGLASIHRFITQVPSGDSYIRVTHFQYDEENDAFVVLWSRSTAGAPPGLNAAGLGGMRDRVPVMADADTAVLVEAWRVFRPRLDVGIGDRVFNEFTVVRPRFLSPIPFTS